MAEHQELAPDPDPNHIIEGQFTAKHLTIVAITIGITFGLIILLAIAFRCDMHRRERQRAQQEDMPGAYSLPAYTNNRDSTHSTASSSSTTAPPDNEGEAHALHTLDSITSPPQASAGVPLEHPLFAGDSNYNYIWGSVQHRTSRRGRRTRVAHERQNSNDSARESVATLPRYEEPPSYESNDGSQNAA
jgi:hypothetical protein